MRCRSPWLPALAAAVVLSQLMQPIANGLPWGDIILTISSFSNSPTTRVTPTGSRLAARDEVRASYAPWLTYISPLAKLLLWAIHFFMLDIGRGDGENSVNGTLLLSSVPFTMSHSIPSRLPLAI